MGTQPLVIGKALSAPPVDWNDGMTVSIATLIRAYRDGTLTPAQVFAGIDRRCAQLADNPVWTYRLTPAERQPFLDRLVGQSPDTLPLYGIPFAIKDNIDLAGIPTTAGCPAFASVPERSATVVERLLAAGAIPVGKTTLDQFATGLNGTRSPWGSVRNPFNPTYISGGSSSGSAVAVAAGLAAFALGTDTAGSGRVPAALNGLIGLKPTRGLLSTRGVVPACRSLDCVSLFAQDAADAALLLTQMAGVDDEDPWSRPAQPAARAVDVSRLRLGVPRPDQLTFGGDTEIAARFEQAVARWEALGATVVPVDIGGLLAAARLLYDGPWVAERDAAFGDFVRTHPQAVLPVIRDILAGAEGRTATSVFQAREQLQVFKQQADQLLSEIDLLLIPTMPRPHTIAALEADPLALNSELGVYTNFLNLLDLAGIAIPAGRLSSGVPWGVTLVGPAFTEPTLLAAAALWEGDAPASSAIASLQQTQTLDIVVCGAHLSGMPLNGQLRERGAVLRQATQTAPCYRLYALAGGPPFRPGLVRDVERGAAIAVEVWGVPIQHVGSFLRLIPHPLGLGKVELADGSWCTSFICEPCGLEGAREITALGGWRAFMATLKV